MIVGVPREIYPKERRMALVPAVIPNLKKAGLEVYVEAGAGLAAFALVAAGRRVWLAGVLALTVIAVGAVLVPPAVVTVTWT